MHRCSPEQKEVSGVSVSAQFFCAQAKAMGRGVAELGKLNSAGLKLDSEGTGEQRGTCLDRSSP